MPTRHQGQPASSISLSRQDGDTPPQPAGKMSSERNQLRTKFQQQTKIIEPILRLKIPMIAKKAVQAT